MMPRRFADRREAGRLLAQKLSAYANRKDAVVLALPRGGVPVGLEVAKALRVPLDVFLVRKLGLPGREELAMGAIASGGVRVINDDVVTYLAVPDSLIEEVAAREEIELERREHLYRGDRALPELRDRVVILVDDGLATGSSMRAAVAALRQHGPSRIVVAVPVAPGSTFREFQREVDEIAAFTVPEDLDGVGRWYDDFSQTSDEEVCDLLRQAAERSDTANAHS